jgi:hypothetical protein
VPRERTATGPRSQRVDRERGVEVLQYRRRGDPLRAEDGSRSAPHSRWLSALILTVGRPIRNLGSSAGPPGARSGVSGRPPDGREPDPDLRIDQRTVGNPIQTSGSRSGRSETRTGIAGRPPGGQNSASCPPDRPPGGREPDPDFRIDLPAFKISIRDSGSGSRQSKTDAGASGSSSRRSEIDAGFVGNISSWFIHRDL